MKELIEYIAKSVVNAPDQVVVTEEETSDGLLLKLQVAADDKGRVIGRQGRVAQAMRTLLRVSSARSGSKTKVELEIL
ncbi:MAG: KH domain-containing protein [Chloroflexi bacterium]|nr:KH domain-containing protein [Chloroflexota bacterium]